MPPLVPSRLRTIRGGVIPSAAAGRRLDGPADWLTGAQAHRLAIPAPVTLRAMRSTELTIATGQKRGLSDLTGACARFVAEHGDGLLHVFVPHATAGLVIMELGAGSEADLMSALDRILPRDDGWHHRHGSPGHGADHVLPLLAPPAVTVPVVAGRLALGTWQSIVLLDPNPDNPSRTVRLSFLPG